MSALQSIHRHNRPVLEIQNYLTSQFDEEIAADIRAGMAAGQKYIPSKYFYDRRGSALFERICSLPEYYLTRTELGLLERWGDAIMREHRYADLVELGSGANWKISTLIEAANGSKPGRLRYIPIDVSETALVSAAEELIARYPGLSVLGIVADFTGGLHVLPEEGPRLIVLFGSTIGNFEDDVCKGLLAEIAASMEEDDRFLIGIDMVKEKALLEAAYNDARGITAAFNRNILHVVNRNLSADFHPGYFAHHAFFDEQSERIEMHLRARAPLVVTIEGLGLEVEFEEGETIRTEISRKFRRDGCTGMFADAGLEVERWITDPEGWFSMVELRI